MCALSRCVVAQVERARGAHAPAATVLAAAAQPVPEPPGNTGAPCHNLPRVYHCNDVMSATCACAHAHVDNKTEIIIRAQRTNQTRARMLHVHTIFRNASAPRNGASSAPRAVKPLRVSEMSRACGVSRTRLSDCSAYSRARLAT
jgi:hypothetical protein